jgi:Fe-S-cluster containining protein
MSQECKCIKCTNGCTFKPGWFLPKEIKLAAETLMMSEKEFFDRYLGVDWYEGIKEIYVLAPATTSMSPGKEYPADPRGQCVFFNNGLCDIHPVKPYECRESYHTDDDNMTMQRHSFVAEKWKDSQDFIIKLLDRIPESENYKIFEALLWY